MIRLALPHYRVANVWIGAPRPPATYDAIHQRTLSFTGAASCSERCAAVEFFQALGGRYHYGLVGGTLAPEPDGRLELVSTSSIPDGPIFPSMLLAPCPGDALRVGLPVEFEGVIALGASRAVANLRPPEIPEGRLVVDVGVHSVVGTSEMLVSYLSCVLVRILVATIDALAPDAVLSLFPYDLEWRGSTEPLGSVGPPDPAG